MSFYGGKPGISFVLTRSYTSVAEMVAAFQQGPTYTEVHFNEYVLINTENKNDPDNGKIYRRGYEYADAMGGAAYVGTIVGPGGPAPKLVLTTVADVESHSGDINSRFEEGDYNPTVNLIPGKDYDDDDNPVWNDAIHWASCSVRDADNKDCTAYLGFKFPYLVIEVLAEDEDPYGNVGVERTDDKTHPYFEEFKFKIPKGKKGDALKNFRVINTAAEIEAVEDYNTDEDPTKQQDDADNGRAILVYDYYDYTDSAAGEKKTIYLGDYNMVKKIEIDEYGTVTIDYAHDDDKVFEQLFKWIDKVELITEGDDAGHFIVTYNVLDENDDPVIYDTYLKWIKDLDIDEYGNVTLSYSYGADYTLPDTKLRWLTGAYIQTRSDTTAEAAGTAAEGSGDQKIHLVWNDENKTETAIGEGLNYIIRVAMRPSDFHILVYYSDPTKRGTVEYDGITGWVDLGTTKDFIPGILIGKMYRFVNSGPADWDNDEVDAALENNYTAAVALLNEKLPAGLGVYYDGTSEQITDPNLVGKIVVFGDGLGKQYFYGFDYTNPAPAGWTATDAGYKGWYYIGTFGDVDMSNLFLFAQDNSASRAVAANLMNNGIWFVLEE